MEKQWKVIAHSHQIADTGDYDGCYELTDGHCSIFTKDDGNEAEDMLNDIAELLNTTGFIFYLDDSEKEVNHYLRAQLDEAQVKIKEL